MLVLSDTSNHPYKNICHGFRGVRVNKHSFSITIQLNHKRPDLRCRFANATQVLLCKSNRQKLENMKNTKRITPTHCEASHGQGGFAPKEILMWISQVQLVTSSFLRQKGRHGSTKEQDAVDHLSHQFHIDIFQIFIINLRYILQIPLK